jgi:hypothetical protein
MTELYCWFYTINKLPEGVPVPLQTAICETFNPKKPMPSFDFNWMDYNYYQMPFPPESKNLLLPQKLCLTVKKLRR